MPSMTSNKKQLMYHSKLGKRIALLAVSAALATSSIVSAQNQNALLITQGDDPDIFIADPDGGNLRPVVAGEGEQSYGVWSPDSQQIAYAALTGDNQDIFVADAEGNRAKQITRNFGTRNNEPSWSPDGQWIAFTSDRVVTPQIYVVDAQGSKEPSALTASPPGSDVTSFAPTWSPDGKEIAFISNRQEMTDQLYVMNADGTEVRPLTTLEDESEKNSPAWSPDGSKIAFGANGAYNAQIEILDRETSQRTIVVATPSTDTSLAQVRNPRWSDNGESLIYLETVDESVALYQINTDGSGKRRLSLDIDSTFIAFAWSAPQQKPLLNYSAAGGDERGDSSSIVVEKTYLKDGPPVTTLEVKRTSLASYNRLPSVWRGIAANTFVDPLEPTTVEYNNTARVAWGAHTFSFFWCITAGVDDFSDVMSAIDVQFAIDGGVIPRWETFMYDWQRPQRQELCRRWVVQLDGFKRGQTYILEVQYSINRDLPVYEVGTYREGYYIQRINLTGR